MESLPVLTVTQEQVQRYRVWAHNLAVRLPVESILTAAGKCGLQNTPPGSAALSLLARISGLTPELIDQALWVEKTLLQAWSLRTAPFIFPTKDWAIFTQGLLPEDQDSIRAMIYGAEAGLDKIDLRAVDLVNLTASAIREVLDSRALTKDQIGVEIANWIASHPEKPLNPEQLAAWFSPSLYVPGQSLGESMVRFALPITALQGICCHGERQGDQAYLVLTAQWLGRTTTIEAAPNEARAELLRRYLSCYGPSTMRHFAEWTGIGLSQAGRTWALIERELTEVRYNGHPTWILREDLEPLQSAPVAQGVRFLPPHDPFLSLRDRSTLISDKRIEREVWKAVGNPGILLVDGQAAGLWRPRKKGSRLMIDIKAFLPLTPGSRNEIETEAEAVAVFRGCKAVEVLYLET